MSIAAIGYKIRQQRKKLGLTQAKVAQQLGISAPYLNLIESNKRTVGGSLIVRLAELLHLEVDELSGLAEQRLLDDLRELPADQMFQHIPLETNFADEIVARNPNWARTLLTLYRAYLDNNQALRMFGDRMSLDPQLQSSVHDMLTHITSIRSSAEILNEMEHIDKAQQDRFHQVIHSESTELSKVAENLVNLFGHQSAKNPSLAPTEELDDFLIGHRNYFPQLESIAWEIRESIEKSSYLTFEEGISSRLEHQHKIRIETISPNAPGNDTFTNQTFFDPDTRQLRFLAHAPNTTRRFQMVRLIASLEQQDTLNELVNDARLTSPAARQRAFLALSAYTAGAILFPYNQFLDAANACRYDIEILRQQFDGSYEQICHRLITLRNPEAEGIPFAFLRVDPAGYVSKRFPLYGFPIPRYGHACPLWAVFSAFQAPGRIFRQISAFPDGHRFLTIASTVTKRAATFRDQPVLYGIMLSCDILHADRTIYTEGIDFTDKTGSQKVGPSCRLCTRPNCQQRQEPPLVALH